MAQLVASTTRLDFGAVAVGSRAVQELVLRNESQTATTFQVGATPRCLVSGLDIFVIH